jgi:UDP-N-acetylmuramoyl-tripeptide--D-alanyl-D-alanine ligase
MNVLDRNTLFNVAQVLSADEPLMDGRFNGVSTDTRTLVSGNLFVALQGPNFDGNECVAEAEEKGAVAVIVSREVECGLPQIIVTDTHKALGQLAAARRAAFKGKLLAVTGSNGKTTVKGMLSAVLSRCGAVLATDGNFNNDIGMPLTLLKLEHEDDFVVLEMGANHIGEIEYLTHIAKPDVALITCAGAAHLKGFGSLDGVAQAKGEIYQGLSEQGVAIINADDSYADYWRQLNREHQILSFGLQSKADVSAKDINQGRDGSLFTAVTSQGEVQIHLSLLGLHNVRNALAVIAMALSVDVPLEEIKLALEAFDAVDGRLKIKQGEHGSTLIDDSYNANPDSLKAAVETLKSFAGQHLLVMGDMYEVGDDAENIHREVGRYAHTHGVEQLFTVGEFAAFVSEGFGTGAKHFATQEALVEELRTDLSPETTVLIKGSRGARMERVVEALMSKEA